MIQEEIDVEKARMTMKKLLITAFILTWGIAGLAGAEDKDRDGGGWNGGGYSGHGNGGTHPHQQRNGNHHSHGNGNSNGYQPVNNNHANFNNRGSRTNGAGAQSFHPINRAHANAYDPAHFARIRSASVAVPGQWRSMGIRSVPRPFTNRNHYVLTDRTHSMVALPSTGPGGGAVSAHVFARASISSPLIQNHMTVVNNHVFIGQINNYTVNETRPNYYYWHSYNGFNYCHYYDSWGYHWYGWYLGGSCFWTRYYWGNWWWYDPGYARWCYWHDGGWWWNDPADTTTVYVYVNGNYQPADLSASTATGAAPSQPVNAPPASDNSVPNPSDQGATNTAPIANKGVYTSPDGTKVVKIFGDTNDAILSDASGSSNSQSVFLASNVQAVKFVNASDGEMQIVLTMQDGSIKTFDSQGASLDSDSTPATNNAGNNT
jgi:hypothetical protein